MRLSKAVTHSGDTSVGRFAACRFALQLEWFGHLLHIATGTAKCEIVFPSAGSIWCRLDLWNVSKRVFDRHEFGKQNWHVDLGRDDKHVEVDR